MAGPDRSGGETMMVRCPACSTLFPAGLQVDRATLEAMVLTSTYRCPHCGHEATFVKADHLPLLIEE